MSISFDNEYRMHDLETAPEQSKDALRSLKRDLGFIPNVAAFMADSPVTLNAFSGIFETFHHGTFTSSERQVLLLSNAVANACGWAVAMHSALALGEGVSAADVRAIRDRRLPSDLKLAALSALTRSLIEECGRADERVVQRFLQAGFRRSQVIEVIVGIAGSVFTNYTANLTRPTVEDQFLSHTWAGWTRTEKT